jgi:hypothetical protein
LEGPALTKTKRRPLLAPATSEVRQPALYRFGNQGINLLRSDGTAQFDFSLLRNFHITEDWRIQFRSEFINAFNHPQFNVPGRVLGGAGFGIVASARPARTIQLGLRMTF